MLEKTIYHSNVTCFPCIGVHENLPPSSANLSLVNSLLWSRPPSHRRISELAAEYQPKKIRLAESAAEFLPP